MPKIDRNQSKLIARIAKRAVHELDLPDGVDLQHVAMSVTACHCNDGQLRLRELLESKGGDFAHDVLGIITNIDQSTGMLQNRFEPRFSGPAPQLSKSDYRALRAVHGYVHGED